MKHTVLMSLALAASSLTASAQNVVFSDEFTTIGDWFAGLGQIRVVNQQFTVYGSFGRMDPNDNLASSANGNHTLPATSRLLDRQTVELRVDLIGIGKKGAWAGMDFVWPGINGYALLMDDGNIALGKFRTDGSGPSAWFFYDHPTLKSQDVTLVLALTRAGSDLRINTQVLDKENSNAVLFDRTMTDTPQSDPALPNRAVLGMPSGPDWAGTPWPLDNGPAALALLMQWTDSVNGTQGAAEVTFDHLQVRRYAVPEMTIEPAVIVSWPVLPGTWIVESSANLEGPYARIPETPEVVGNRLQIAVPASEQTRYFRLRL